MKTKRTPSISSLLASLAVSLILVLAPARFARAENPNIPDDDEIAAYAEDGSLEERIAYQESLEDDGLSPALLSTLEQDPSAAVWTRDRTMPKTGSGRIIAFRVSFPAGDGEAAMGFTEGDTLEALQQMIDGSAGTAPYVDLASYYAASSYGQLSISGDSFDYEALYPRSHYTGNDNELFGEVLRAFDDQLDYTDYDGNGDGVIDCVVIHFAGDNTGWGTTWWSSVQNLTIYDEDGELATFDGELPGTRMLLHEPSNTDAGLRTIIHETGHTLGLPDYYQSPHLSGDGGIRTFDMMNNNIGDHNGYSKWMLGWLDDDADVTWVTVTEDGVTATRGGQSVGTPTVDGGLAVDLDPFTSDEIGETGGIIVVADHGPDKYSKYYVLQYDVPAGNQSIFWGSADDPRTLSSGFRLYRVQGEVSDWDELVHTNIDGTLHDQLIELVDPDYDVQHTEDTQNGIANTGELGDRWGCMLYEGDTVTPASSPSTNFYENSSAGWTGISLEVIRSDADGGTVVFRFDPAKRPENPDIELSCAEGSELVPGATIVIEANTEVTLDPSAKPLIKLGDGTLLQAESAESRGTTIYVRTRVDAGALSKAGTAAIVFEEGSFVLLGGEVSPEISVDVPIGGVRICDTGVVGGSSHAPGQVSLSEVLEDPDGTRFFYQCDSDKPFIGERVYYKNVIDPDDPRKVTKVLLEGADAEAAQAYFYAQSFMAETSRGDAVAHLIPEGADLGAHEWVLDAAEKDGRVYVLSQGWDDSEKVVSVFDGDGTLRARTSLGVSEHGYGRILFGPDGTISVTLYPPFYTDTIQQVTFFLDGELASLGTLTTNGNNCVQWLDDGRFMTYDWRYSAQFAEGGSTIDPLFALGYDITCPFGKKDDPDEPDDPVDPEDGEEQEPAHDGSAIPATGDALNTMAAAFAAAGISLLVLCGAASRRRA